MLAIENHRRPERAMHGFFLRSYYKEHDIGERCVCKEVTSQASSMYDESANWGSECHAAME